MNAADRLVTVARQEYDVPSGAAFPEAMTGSVFIPGVGAGGVHHCFLVDVQRRHVTSWTIDVSKAIERVMTSLSASAPKAVPWNQETLRKFIEVVHFPHSVDRWGDWIFVTLIEGGFVVALHAYRDQHYVVFDEAAGLNKMYSSTNQIRDGKMHFTRWNIGDTFAHERERHHLIELEVGAYDIESREFRTIQKMRGPDDIHYTAVSADHRHLVVVEMTQDPLNPAPVDRVFDALPGEEKRRILAAGLHLSEVITLDVATGASDRLQVAGGPAHLEWEDRDPAVYYLSSHNLVTNNDTLYCFGNCRIDRFRLEEGRSVLEASYETPDLLRGPSHRLLSFDGQALMTIPVYPNQIHIVNRDTMTLVKKVIVGRRSSVVPDFAEGPVRYPPPNQEKTPYTVDAEQNTPLLYLSSVWEVAAYDFQSERKVGSLAYNRDAPVILMGHASMFQMGSRS